MSVSGESTPDSVCSIQRFGGILSCNIYYHIVISDGTFDEQGGFSSPRISSSCLPKSTGIALTVARSGGMLLLEKVNFYSALINKTSALTKSFLQKNAKTISNVLKTQNMISNLLKSQRG